MSKVTLTDKTEEKALAIPEIDSNLASFGVFSMDPEELAELREDMGMGEGSAANRFDLPKIKMPSGGILAYVMPDGSTQKTIKGIILGFKDTRIFYADPDSQGTPPDCTSEDMHTGFGIQNAKQIQPGVCNCAKCPNNMWGSHPKGTGGKACSERRLLAIQMETGLVPMLLSLPVTSVKPVTEAMRAIVSMNGATINNFIVKLSMTEKVSKGGSKYAVVQIDPEVTMIKPELKATMKAMRRTIQAVLDSVPARTIVEDDYNA